MNGADKVAYEGLIVAVISLGASVLSLIVALVVSLYATKRANKTAAAALFLSFTEAFDGAWSRYFAAKGRKKKLEAASHLLNLFENACAFHLEGSLDGVSRDFAEAYMKSILGDFIKHIGDDMGLLIQDAKTYEHIKKFLNCELATASGVVPDAWYKRIC